MAIDLSYCRKQFPSLDQKVGTYPVAYLDGPGGTQVPQGVIDAMVRYLTEYNANAHGSFLASQNTDRVIGNARQRAADLLGAGSWRQIVFGQNMTTLNFALARSFARAFPKGEVLTTEIDHHANIDPWESLSESGISCKRVRMNTETCTLDMKDLEEKLSSNTKLVAVNYASNALGTVNDVAAVASLAHDAGAFVVVDAVHYAAHAPVDVQAIDCDILLCSAYKFFGPHVGIMYIKPEVADRLEAYKLAPQWDEIPDKFETGTLNHEGLAGVGAAIDFIESLGDPVPGDARASVVRGMEAIEEYEEPLLQQILEGLRSIPGIRVYGPPEGHPRTPTVSFTLERKTPTEVAGFLGDRGIFVWDGDFYATTVVERLGLSDKGGLIRVGLAPYNTSEEIDRLIKALEEIAS